MKRFLPLLLLATTVYGQTPGDVVGRIHGKNVTRLEAPDGRTLMGMVIGTLVQEFAKDEKVDVSREEAAAYAAHIDRSMNTSRATWRSRLARLEAEAAKAPADARRKELDEEIASLKRTIALDADAQKSIGTLTPSQLRSVNEDTTGTILRQYKINQALYRRYGGRVIFQQFGPEPLDAYRQLLLDQQKKGTFAILDKSYEKGFWEYVTNEKMHTFITGDDATESMTTAWWMKDAPSEETPKPPRGERVDLRIDGKTLSSSEGGFSITPRDKGNWGEITVTSSKAMRTMFWDGSDYDRAMDLDIIRDARRTTTDAFARVVVSTFVKNAAKSGSTVTNVAYARSTLPTPGSCRFSYVETMPQRPPLYVFGYVTGEGVKVTLRTWSSEPKEPSAFTAFVSAFAFSAP